VYNSIPGTSDAFNGISALSESFEDKFLYINRSKVIDGTFEKYPGDLVYLNYNGSSFDLVHTTYIIPFIHATSKTQGSSGWNFVYHDTSSMLPTYGLNNFYGIGAETISFNFIVGPILYGSYLSDSGLRRPNIPYVDRYSWKKPEWINYDFDKVINSHPSINPDHLFLDAPLRDIISGVAGTEEYWLNSPVERISSKKNNDLFSDFEWIVSIGGGSSDSGLKVKVDYEGNIYLTGYFGGSITFGKSSNLPASTRTIASNSNQSIFIAKYNPLGIIQWAKAWGGTTNDDKDWDYYPASIDTDIYGNILVAGYNEKNRTTYNPGTGDKSNVIVKWTFDGDQEYATNLFTSPSGATDVNLAVKTDKIGNVFVGGIYNGTLSSGNITLTATQASEGFIAKIENGTVIWLKAINQDVLVTALDFSLGGKNDLYLTYNFYSSESGVSLGKYGSLDFVQEWKTDIILTDSVTTTLNPQIDVNKNGEILLTTSFEGRLTCQGIAITSATSSISDIDFGIFKFEVTSNLLWAKKAGSSGVADYINGARIYDDGRCYILGSYTGYFVNSPVVIGPPIGQSDLVLLKYETDGSLIDIISIGSTSSDSGEGIDLDGYGNIYITGYISGTVEAFPWTVSPSGGSRDIFIGKIPQKRYIIGKNHGAILSWYGSSTIESPETKIFNNEFEIPVGTPVILNPVDSNIPGKNSYTWVLSDSVSGDVIVSIKDVPYFIWTFRTPGYYTIETSFRDANGNLYKTVKDGYIRVINHKEPNEEDLVPEIVNSFDYDYRTIYGERPTIELKRNLLQNP